MYMSTHYLNTSHVNVNLLLNSLKGTIQANLNTSHVNVNLFLVEQLET